jgi:hypothetical protein
MELNQARTQVKKAEFIGDLGIQLDSIHAFDKLLKT